MLFQLNKLAQLLVLISCFHIGQAQLREIPLEVINSYSMPIEDIAKAVVGTERYVQSDYSAFVPIVLDFGKEKLAKVLNQVSKIDLPATDSTTEYFIPSNGGKIQVNNWTEPSKEELVKAAEEITLEIPRSKTPRAKFKIDID